MGKHPRTRLMGSEPVGGRHHFREGEVIPAYGVKEHSTGIIARATVSTTEHAARLNWLLSNGFFVSRLWSDETIRVTFLNAVGEKFRVVPVTIVELQ
jgi:hypothetical protein